MSLTERAFSDAGVPVRASGDAGLAADTPSASSHSHAGGPAGDEGRAGRAFSNPSRPRGGTGRRCWPSRLCWSRIWRRGWPKGMPAKNNMTRWPSVSKTWNGCWRHPGRTFERQLPAGRTGPAAE